MKTSKPAELNQWFVRGTAGLTVADTAAMDVARAWCAGPLDHWIIVFASHRKGSGKSFAAAWAVERLYEMLENKEEAERAGPWEARGSVYCWVTCAALASLGALKPWEREGAIDRMRKTWLLVLDDMGTEPKPAQLQSILEHRYSERLLTIVTTNLIGDDGRPSKEWWERYDGRLRSRMVAHGDRELNRISCWHLCSGPDMRGAVRPELHPQPEPGPGVDVDIDAIARPFLVSTNPTALARAADERIHAENEADDVEQDLQRLRVRAGLALQVLEERAANGCVVSVALLELVDTRHRSACPRGFEPVGKAGGGQ